MRSALLQDESYRGMTFTGMGQRCNQALPRGEYEHLGEVRVAIAGGVLVDAVKLKRLEEGSYWWIGLKDAGQIRWS